ncbi:MAG TPA: HAMP domain-containing sensor histidine kinase [Thermoanaerobaculia bacterium]|nr:HAMP domain-containing sensor histidine kinase [Thermoanaerobaculia bacterium]
MTTLNDSSPTLVGEEFLSLVSHEIKNPLTSITGFANFAEDAVRKNDRTMALESLQIVRNEARRILKLAEDLLDASCVRAGKFAVNIGRVDLHALLSEVVKRYAAMSGRRIDLWVPAMLPEVPADPVRLAQVVENLVSNAVKYSPDDSPIRVKVFASDTAVRVAITNGGKIIPASMLDQLFKRFSRLGGDADGNGRRKGTGLGLFISKQIVEMHGGSIQVTSTAEDGTTFTFELPVR